MVLPGFLATQLVGGLPAPQVSPDTPVIRINVNLVQVDAVVTDAAGRPVTDLRADDFELLQDGKPRAITSFEFVDLRKPTSATSTRSPSPQRRGALPIPPTPTRGLRPENIRRATAFVVDDLGLAFDSIVHVKESLAKWVDSEMQPGDLVAVIRTSAGMGSMQQFTTDKRALHAAIDLIRFQVARVGSTSFAPLNGATPPGSVDTTTFDQELVQRYRLGSLTSIQYVVQGLIDVPGRKSLILFSESLQLTSPEGRNQEAEEYLRRVTDAANRSSVVIYGIDPRGVINTTLTAEDNGNGLTSQQLSQVAGQRTTELFYSQEGLETMAQKTGGLFVRVGNNISDSLRRAVDDGNGYYLLGYQPEGSTFQSPVAKFHSITVRVKRPGLTVRSRTGFFGTPDRAIPIPRTPIDQIKRALSAPFATGDVSIRLTPLFSYDEKQGASIDALLYFDVHDLTFTKESDGSSTAQIDIAAVTFDTEGNQIDGADKTWKFRVTAENYANVLKTGIVYSIHVPVKKPGGYQMRVVLRDSGSQRLGSATQFVEIPDVKKGRLALSGLVLGADQNQRATEKVEEGLFTGKDPNVSPAVRIFNSGASIVYGYKIFNARVDKSKKPQLQVRTRIFRDGQSFREGETTTPGGQGQLNSQQLVGLGRVQLNQMPPGDYVLQVVVIDKLAPEKYRIAAQSMDFEVRQ